MKILEKTTWTSSLFGVHFETRFASLALFSTDTVLSLSLSRFFFLRRIAKLNLPRKKLFSFYFSSLYGWWWWGRRKSRWKHWENDKNSNCLHIVKLFVFVVAICGAMRGKKLYIKEKLHRLNSHMYGKQRKNWQILFPFFLQHLLSLEVIKSAEEKTKKFCASLSIFFFGSFLLSFFCSSLTEELIKWKFLWSQSLCRQPTISYAWIFDTTTKFYIISVFYSFIRNFNLSCNFFFLFRNIEILSEYSKSRKSLSLKLHSHFQP